MIYDFFLVFLLNHVLLDNKAGFPLVNIFAQSDFFPLSLSFRLKPSGTNYVETKEKSRFGRKYSLVENRLNLSRAFSSPCLWSYLLRHTCVVLVISVERVTSAIATSARITSAYFCAYNIVHCYCSGITIYYYLIDCILVFIDW